ncbi:MAG: orotate phosphoribosyltransferase [Candidatus Hodarchaeales archaeon]
MGSLSKEHKHKLVQLLKKINAIKFGNFVLKDGTTSRVYIDLRILTNFPTEFKEIMNLTLKYIEDSKLIDEFDGIIAPPLAGVPLGSIMAYLLNKEFYLARLTPKKHGTKKLIEGNIRNKRIMIVDDVITSGGSKIPLLDNILEHGGVISSLFVFVNRVHDIDVLTNLESKYGIKVHYLLTLDDILGYEQ